MTPDAAVLTATGADVLTGRAVRACAPRYNEVCIGATSAGVGVLLVVFHACRGAETSWGARMVRLERVPTSPSDAVWRVESDVFTPMVGLELTSRRGHVASTESPFARV